MRIKFAGAARCVTGSCFLVETGKKKFLVDCGLFQGLDQREGVTDFLFDPLKIDFVLLTHAHIDHAGRLPLLYKKGFRGKVYSTKATKELSKIMLADSAHIQKQESEWASRKLKRGGIVKLAEPLYSLEDAKKVCEQFVAMPYEKEFAPDENIKVTFHDAGHLLGSASISIVITEGGEEKRFVFSGDIGNYNQPLIKNYTKLKDADYVICESTYGDQFHPIDSRTVTSLDRAKILANIVDETFRLGGNVIIPAFAVGRSQEILYLFKLIQIHKMVPYEIPVYLDSPMAVAATGVFGSSIVECFDEEAKSLVKKGDNPIDFPSLKTITDSAESKKLNENQECCVIISSSGMCEAGRIKHHLKHNLWRSNCSVVFSGYQAQGTLGRSILDGSKHVTIFGEQIDIKAKIYSLKTLSGHADQSGIVEYLESFKTGTIQPKEIFVVHGEEFDAKYFAGYVNKFLGYSSYAPKLGEVFDLLKDRLPNTQYAPIEDSSDLRILKNEVKKMKERLKQFDELEELFETKISTLGRKDKTGTKQLLNTVLRFTNDISDIIKKWSKDIKG